MNDSRCVCGRFKISPSGSADAEILLIGDAPTIFDIREGRPWSGDVGKMLDMELRRAGISPTRCRLTNMWGHVKVKECDIGNHLDALYQDMNRAAYVVLMGADVTTFFTGENVSDVSGLRVDHLPTAKEKLPASLRAAYAIFNPGLALFEKLGEIRWGLQSIAEDMNDN